jgi:hypothetical protein
MSAKYRDTVKETSLYPTSALRHVSHPVCSMSVTPVSAPLPRVLGFCLTEISIASLVARATGKTGRAPVRISSEIQSLGCLAIEFTYPTYLLLRIIARTQLLN